VQFVLSRSSCATSPCCVLDTAGLEDVRRPRGRNNAAWYALVGVLCRWGRIGEDPRGVRLHEFADKDEALWLAAKVVELRVRHGYVIK
jgi:predicted DNA-binding WGR domain protein